MADHQLNIADTVHHIKTFDKDILQAETDQFLNEFGNAGYLKKRKYLIRTKFHRQFSFWLQQISDEGLDINPTYMSGIQGMGTTTSLLYFVLERMKQKQNDVHYVDLRYLNKESSLEKFRQYVSDFESNSLLIIDHATLDTVSKVKQIIEAAQTRRLNVVVMETGFTASNHANSFTVRKNCQLNEEEFLNIWNGTLKEIGADVCEPEIDGKLKLLLEQGKEVYFELAKSFVMTPRLLNFILKQMLHWDKSVLDAASNYEMHIKSEIEEFSVKEDDELYSKFCLHTRIFLHNIQPGTDCIFPLDVLHHMHIAVNIFDVNQGKVTHDDLENDPRFKELQLAEGDTFVRLSHLVPVLAVYWQQKLPYSVESVLAVTDDAIFGVMFTFGSFRKKYEELLVQFQRKKEMVICPSNVEQTLYELSDAYCDMEQTKFWGLRMFYSDDCYLSPTSENLASIPTDFQGSERNIAKCGVFIRKHIEKDEYRQLLVYPQTGSLIGIYFLYLPNERDEQLSAKRPKLPKTLHLMQVATRATHSGDTIGRVLNVLKQIFSDLDVKIHVSIIISKSDSSPYRLHNCRFKNVSVINLATKKKVLSENRLLHKLTEQLEKLN